MKKINFLEIYKNIKNNFWLLLSITATLFLFLTPSLTSIVFIAVIYLTATTVVVLDIVKRVVVSGRYVSIARIFLTVLIERMGFNNFYTTWAHSEKFSILAGMFGTTTKSFLLINGVLGCVVGFYAMYVIADWIVFLSIKLIREQLPIQDKTKIKANLKQNWYFPISAIAFFVLSVTPTMANALGLCLAFIIITFVSSQISSMLKQMKNSSILFRTLSFATAVGICLAGWESFYANWSISFITQQLEVIFPIAFDIPKVISVVVAVIAIPFVYFCLCWFWNCIKRVLINAGLFCDIKTTEWIVYGVLVVVMLGYMIFSFSHSQVFYATKLSYDVIYTSDSPILVKTNVYLTLMHSENDLRQPLFAVFAAPFVGIPYMLSRLIGASVTIQAILINSIQIVMLFTANYMFAKTLKLDSLKRICFMVLTSCTYTDLLFVVMMEQYIVAYFWLAFCIYLVVEKHQLNRIALWGAGGTLLTSMILLPLMSIKSPIDDLKSWFNNMVKYGFEFVILMLAFCRFDVFFSLMYRISFLSQFTGKAVTFADKIYQYTEFIVNCLFAPNAGVNTISYDYVSWQLDTANRINFIGVLILLLAFFSAFWNRDKKISILALAWILFSMVMLLGLGWGTKENGLILYTLYFGWAFLVLLFQLIEKIESNLNIRCLIPVFTACVVVILLIINIPEIMKLVKFAIMYYPI